MSLVSPRNFAAPFSNKVHLIAIMLVSMLFAAFRLSGGGIESRESLSARAPARSSADQEVLQLKRYEQKSPQDNDIFAGEAMGTGSAPTRGTMRRGVGGEDEDIITGDSRANNRPTGLVAPDKPNSGKSSGELDDIERQLGLR